MESKVNYTVVGAFILFFIASLIFFIIWLSGTRDHRAYTTYLAIMNESVNGLTFNSAVKYNGVTVGDVNDIVLNTHNPNQVRVLLNIARDIPIKEDTRAMLMSQGLTGLSFVNLTGGSPTSPALKREKNQKYPIIKTKPSLMFRLDAAMRQLSITLTSLSKDVREVLDKDNRLAVKHTLQQIEQLTATLAANANQIDAGIKSSEIILKNTAKASQELPLLLNNLNRASVNVIAVTQKLSKTSEKTTVAMQDAHTFMQTVSHQVLPQAIQTLNRLQNASGQIKDLALDLRQNPAMLIRGRQSINLGPGE